MPQKENIWELVSGRSFHSCLITTYSFDFYYFEKSVMRILRSKGIGNISIFIDNNIFQGILGKIGSSSSRVYSISPINSNGCFHPKVYMFFGEKQGLLIIGSGNLTSSGHGKNDEIWGAFHFDATDPNYTQLFSNSWSFFEKISQNIKGFAKEKIRWIKEYTPWIETLPSPNSTSLDKLNNSTQIAFLNNNSETSIFQQLSELVPFDKVKELTIVAPYFDFKGKIIELFLKSLPKATINVLVDDKNGILPFGLAPNIANQVNFYHWKDCFSNKDDDKGYSRLHAKLLNFSLNDNSQICLLGSANASVAALGTEYVSAINEEVSILLNSSDHDYLKDLGIKINPKKSQNLTDFEEGLNESAVFENTIAFEYNIEAIDKEGNVLNIYLDKILEADVEIHMFNNWGEVIYSGKLIEKNNRYFIKIPPNLFNPIYGCLKDSKTTEIVSNKQIIQDVYVLAKTNPDPQKQILDVLFSSIEQGDELLFSKLIDCISTDDFNAENKSFSTKVSPKKPDEEKEDIEIKGKVLDYEEFKDVSYDSIQHQYYVLNSSSNRVADFLSSLSLIKSKEEIASAEFDDEELDLEIDDAQGREDQPKLKSVTKSAFKSEKSRIIKFLERYNNHLEKEVDKLIKKSNQNVDEEGKVSITELSNFVIALYIAIYYTDNKRQYTIDEETHHETIIKSYGFEYYDNLPAINADLIGKFLFLCTRGFKTYDSNYLNERLERLRREAFYHCVFCLAQAKWSNSELIYKNLLLINAVHFLPKDSAQLLNLNQFTEEMNIRNKLSANVNLNLISDIKTQIDNILPKYSSFVDNMNLCTNERKTVLSKDLMTETVIFTSRFGFCMIKYKTIQNDGAILTLSRPGFPWIEKEEEYLLEEKRLYKRNIVL
jgi:hypothetical protein